MTNRSFDFDRSRYEELLKAIGLLSGLYGESKNNNIHYRTVEKLFINATKGKDLSRQDKVFDALVGTNFDIGVGIKTFGITSKSVSSKLEKIQELTRYAGLGHLKGLSSPALARKVAEFRNKSIQSDCNQFGVRISKSIYHCLIRLGQDAYIHEEPYPLIDLDNIFPVNSSGKRVSKWISHKSLIHFSDGLNHYSYHKAKNTLSMRFEFSKSLRSRPIRMQKVEEIWSRLDAEVLLEALMRKKYVEKPNYSHVYANLGIPGVNYVVLPLYSKSKSGNVVREKSGINFWNAGGRRRKYGEAYIPVPIEIHKRCPGFFPKVGKRFKLQLPNNVNPVNASLCQAAGKALMSERNNELCRWLYKVLDPSISDDDYTKSPTRDPFGYSDLIEIGRDSVIVSKIHNGNSPTFEIDFGLIGDYEKFLSELEKKGVKE